MPIMDGYETSLEIQKLIESESIENIPVVALSAALNEKEKEKCLKFGMKDYLLKPIEEKGFMNLMAKLNISCWDFGVKINKFIVIGNINFLILTYVYKWNENSLWVYFCNVVFTLNYIVWILMCCL